MKTPSRRFLVYLAVGRVFRSCRQPPRHALRRRVHHGRQLDEALDIVRRQEGIDVRQHGAYAGRPRLEALDAPLVSPAPGTTNGTWFQDFTTQAEARWLRIDFTAVHWYAGPNSASLISLLQNVYNTHNRPVWLTEFSVVSWSGTDTWTRGANYNFLAEFLWRAESLPWLRRYSLFQYMEGSGSGTDTATAPRSNTRNADGSITAFGALYAGWDGITSILHDKAYHLHNRNVYARVQNPGNTSTPSDSVTSVSPEISALGTQWYLIPGTSANTVRIISRRDGRRLRFFNGDRKSTRLNSSH